jgi:acyl dehydratase
VAGAQEGPRGITVRIAMTGDAGGERVWSGEAEMLSRSPETTRRARERGRERAAVRLADPERASRVAIDAPEDTGRRYARVSNDWNPHHLHWTVSRLLGYPQPIAHGMWTLARALAELERGGAGPIARTEVRFKKPLFLPGRATLRWNTEPAEVTFEVRETDGPAVHVTGLAAPG